MDKEEYTIEQLESFNDRKIDAIIESLIFGFGDRVKILDSGNALIMGAFPLAVKNYSSYVPTSMFVVEEMTKQGWWCQIKTPFIDGDTYSAGFTLKGITGWNGRPDFYCQNGSLSKAICISAILAKMPYSKKSDAAKRIQDNTEKFHKIVQEKLDQEIRYENWLSQFKVVKIWRGIRDCFEI